MNVAGLTRIVADRLRDIPRRHLASGAALVIVVVAAISIVAPRTSADPQDQARREIQDIVARVGELMELPDEEPLIATVKDPAQFADQPYFRNASVGDKVIIYNGAKKAILYNPETGRIVDVAPLGPGSATPMTSPEQ